MKRSYMLEIQVESLQTGFICVCTHMKDVIRTFLSDKAVRNTPALTALMGAVGTFGLPWHG